MEHFMKLAFNIEEPNNSITNVFVVDQDTQWTELVVKFADFLNAYYGYDVKEKIVFLSDFNFHDKWSVVGERTISRDAYSVAKSFDEEREQAPWEDDEE
jgi:hypothetical protein